MKTRIKSNARIAAYVRVSTVGQNESGQRAEICKWLDGHGIEAGSVRWFIDKKTGDNLDRPEFKRLQSAVFSGEVGTICVYKLDRISRSLQDGINTLCDWLSRGVRLVATSQQLDFSGVTGKLIASVLFAVAEMETETRRERQRAGIEVAKREGRYRGRKPGTLKHDPRRALQLREKGLGTAEIATALGINRVTVLRYLKQAAMQGVAE